MRQVTHAADDIELTGLGIDYKSCYYHKEIQPDCTYLRIEATQHHLWRFATNSNMKLIGLYIQPPIYMK